MSITVYNVGDVARIAAAYTDVDGVAADPTVVKLVYKDASGNVTTLVYGTDAEVIQASTGNYYVDVALDERGIWFYEWLSTGTGATAQEGELHVQPRAVSP